MSLKKYIVGGWVRDKLLTELGHPIQSNDKDWVVTGATPEEMLRLNFVPVGNDFPVFLHPKTHEEYALGPNEKAGTGIKALLFLPILPLRWSRISCGATLPSTQWRWMKRDTLLIPTAVSKT